jgi:L-ascorbate metabolism protein UlaG (beta-lactamase superfamily)
MEITHIGHACFKIKGSDLTILIDPYKGDKLGYKFPKQSCDVLLISHDHGDHNNIDDVSDHRLLVDSPGEFEVSGVFIYGIPTFHDTKKGSDRGKNTMFLIEIDGFSLLHLGDLGHELSQKTLEKISHVDVLMIPVGGTYTIGPEEAAKVISSLEPGLVIPMHFQTEDLTGLSKELAPLDKFMDEMGIENNSKAKDKLVLKSKKDIPSETEIVILKPAH